jgi:3-oxoacyl-[acyl-carrier protein] reductase
MTGQTALVTGSTGGIGRAVAAELASHGAHVVVNGRSAEHGEPVVAAIEDAGGSAAFRAADINDYDQVTRLVGGVVADRGGIDVLVPNGAATSAPIPDYFRGTDPEDMLSFAESMFANRLYVIRAALEPMIEAGGGRIVSIGADSGRWPTPGEVGPGTASAALMMATKVLARELGRWDITVNAVSISVTEDTPALEWVMEESPAASVFERAMERQQFDVTAEDIAQAVAFLAGADGGGAVTGQLLSVNGGISFPG